MACAAHGPCDPGAYPVVKGRIPFSRFRKRIVRFTAKGAGRVLNRYGRRHYLSGTLSWRLRFTLRKSVSQGTGCIENGRPSGFVWTKVG
jgi:hypothetical protein